MGNSVTLGGDRLGSGKKQKVQLHGFERSTHDLGYVWRNTQAPGTLVPFMTMLALPGDTFDIDLQADVKTHPTLGPLFASFKLQLDVFECPIRLYHGWLHNNKLKIGNDMSKVKLPQITFNFNKLIFDDGNLYDIPLEFQQVNQSSLFAYLGLRGFGNGSELELETTKNAVPYLAYWDIYKNYYANKQEEIGYVIHNTESMDSVGVVKVTDQTPDPEEIVYEGQGYNMMVPMEGNPSHNYEFIIEYGGLTAPSEVKLIVSEVSNLAIYYPIIMPVTNTGASGNYTLTGTITIGGDKILWGLQTPEYYSRTWKNVINTIKLVDFPLENIDTMRENILAHNNSTAFSLNDNGIYPYNLPYTPIQNAYSYNNISTVSVMEGLAIKTYQSDIFNNWLNTEWIDGTGGINDITSISTAGGSFDINTLNLANKVYDMLNRIAVSGGTYEDWLNAVYDHDSYRRCETPMYHGGLSKEIVFQEVVGTATTQTENENMNQQNQYNNHPLGSLGGRGLLSNKHKGGKVTIKVNEPSFIIGIVSITPRIDYYQGNEFFTLHQTMNDLHKPSLDEIGFQDLVTDKMAFWDTTTDHEGTTTFNSAGKQPAWIDYMTNFNKLYGNFADSRNEMYMTLARRYEADLETHRIKDLTTYIDPTKFNYAFAQTDLTAMNFWVQIGCDITARRKMSAKIMPNL